MTGYFGRYVVSGGYVVMSFHMTLKITFSGSRVVTLSAGERRR